MNKAASDLVNELMPPDASSRSRFGKKLGVSFSFASVVADGPMDALDTEFWEPKLWDASTY